MSMQSWSGKISYFSLVMINKLIAYVKLGVVTIEPNFNEIQNLSMNVCNITIVKL